MWVNECNESSAVQINSLSVVEKHKRIFICSSRFVCMFYVKNVQRVEADRVEAEH